MDMAPVVVIPTFPISEMIFFLQAIAEMKKQTKIYFTLM